MPPRGGKAKAAPSPSELASSLAFASRVGDLEEVRRLLAADADPNTRDEVGETALFEAAASGNAGVVATLLLAGADPDVQSLMGQAAVDSASSDTAQALLRLCAGEVISAAERRDVLAAMPDAELHEQIRLFIQSLLGEEDEAPGDAFEPGSGEELEPDEGDEDSTEEELVPLDVHREGRGASKGKNLDPEDDDAWDIPILPVSPQQLMTRKKAEPPKPVVEVQIVVTHAIQDGQIRLRLMSDATFGDVKQAIVRRLEGTGHEARNLYLVRKERDAYQAYRDKDPIEDVRELRLVGAPLPSQEEGDL